MRSRSRSQRPFFHSVGAGAGSRSRSTGSGSGSDMLNTFLYCFTTIFSLNCTVPMSQKQACNSLAIYARPVHYLFPHKHDHNSYVHCLAYDEIKYFYFYFYFYRLHKRVKGEGYIILCTLYKNLMKSNRGQQYTKINIG